MLNLKKTNIVAILDRSGSMESVRDATIEGFNKFLADQQRVDGECTLSLVQFDNVIETVFSGVDIRKINKMDREKFQPRGGTALNDAIVCGIKLAEGLPTVSNNNGWVQDGWVKDDSLTLIVILTDGGENASTMYRETRYIHSLITTKRKAGWEFVFIGANQDAFATSNNYGIAHGSTINYTATYAGTNDAFAKLSSNTATYRGMSGATSGSFFDSTTTKESK